MQEEVVKKTEEVEQEAEEKIVSVRQRAEVRRAQATTPQERTQIDVEVAQEIQQVEAERTVETAKVQEEVREVAIEQVRQKYGSNIAVPLETGFDTPVVAFATVDSRGIVAVAENAHELDAPPEDHSSTLDDAVLAFIEQEEYILVADTEE